MDFAPTFLEAAGIPIPSSVTGKSLLPILLSAESGHINMGRDEVVFGIERHFPGSRPDGVGYPMRGIRTKEYLCIRNLMPDLSPVGDRPGPVWPEGDPVGGFGDTDGGMNGEAVLTNLVAAEMRESACDFSLSQNPEEVLSEVVRVQKSLIQGVKSHLKEQPAPPIAALIQKLKLR